MKKALFVLALLALVSCVRYPKLPVEQFQKMMAETPDVQLVDVRTPAEYAEGHIPGAINIDWREDDFLEQAEAQLDKSRPLMVYCRSGNRSKQAAQKLFNLGYTNVYEFGGIINWTGDVVTSE